MKLNFRRIASVLASSVMLTSTVALAAAANYPAPFVKNGGADVAVVWGSTAANTDLVAVTDITANLQAKLASQTATGGSTSTGTVSGESGALFTSSTKLYINDTLSIVKSVVTKSELPTILKDGSFSGNVDATYTQVIDVGSKPQLTFAKQPTSSNDPSFGLALTTGSANYIYNASVTFNKAVALNHSDSEGQDITLFGQKFTIASATDGTDLVLLKTAERISLSSDDPSSTVTVGGKEYTVELVSASDTAATVKVTDDTGASETKEVSENASKKIQGITIAITNADETNLKLSASVIAGAEKLTLTSGSSITSGDDAKVLDGTLATFTGGTAAMTKLVVTVSAPNSDSDAILPGQAFNDPIFGTFKVDFPSLNIGRNGTGYEEIKVSPSGDDKLQLTMTDYRGNEKTIQYARNISGGTTELQHDGDGRNITVNERGRLFREEMVVVGNEDEGRLLKLTKVENQTTGYSSDKVIFSDVFSGDSYTTTITAEGSGTVTIGGKVYTVAYNGTNSLSEDLRDVELQYPDSSGAGSMVLYPTIMTKKGALVAFYEPIMNFNLSNWDGVVGGNTNLTTLSFPDGDGYTDVTVIAPIVVNSGFMNWSVGGSILNTTQLAGQSSVAMTIGRLTYNITSSIENNTADIYLRNPDSGTNILNPAIIIFEEKDDNTQYEALIITLEGGGVSADGLGVNDVIRTWQNDGTWDSITLASDSKKAEEADLFGSIVRVDSGDTDQKIATVWYPDEQITANLYIGEKTSSVEGGTSSGGSVKELGSVTVMDSEAGSVATKNLIVVGGSCVNSVAAELLGGALCGADFETKTGVASGSFLIQTYSRSGDKVATLVAGYNAGDTTNAAKFLTTQAVDTTVGKKYKGTSATSAELVTEAS